MENVKIINLTGHPLTITDGEKIMTLPSEGRVRVDSSKKTLRTVWYEGIGMPVVGIKRKEVTGLPPPEDGVVYIVSGIAADTANRDDVLSPGGLVRENGKGRVMGCRQFIRVVEKLSQTVGIAGMAEWQTQET
jgi:hypothetical protein